MRFRRSGMGYFTFFWAKKNCQLICGPYEPQGLLDLLTEAHSAQYIYD